jgi:ribonuclease E
VHFEEGGNPMKRMLINATQAEERRLAIVDGQKLLDYEIEIDGREQRKGNIYKAVVTRVEPSLEACFVDYGEDRHGFLPFKEISRMYFKEGVSASQARIQDVIKEGQELLVQVEKEERGNKGAALTTFVSLAGRYVVLMPNNPRGGGVSRRIEGEDRAELKENMDQLEYPNGMSIIARTAGIGRSAPELQWDLNYLLKLWAAIDGAAKGAKGAFLIYQESSLVIRAIRDYFNHDIGDILIDTDDVYEQAQQFMAHVMPEHAARVKRYRDDAPLFSRFQIEHQIESAYARTVTLPSGGAIVIDHTEALVSVDVNSARAIKGGDIEETATRTNLEAADEVARQMRLRDLGGLIVIDFIDMEESRNRREVENRLRDALRQDRARVQFGTISKFGLMEMSRQRLRPALSEGASIPCPRCGGAGHIRDTESSALQILRIIQEESLKDSTASVLCQVPVDVASFLLNEKRSEIAKIELKQRINVLLVPNKTLETPNYKLERLKHDDPRLDNIDASYKLADEMEDPTGVTRRSQEPTNKQTPVIKGVLPDAPAPIAVAKPESSKPATAPKQPAQAAPQAASSGFFGWIKSLFGGSTAAPTPPAPVARPAQGSRDNNRSGRSGQRDGNRQGARNDNNTEGRSAGRNDAQQRGPRNDANTAEAGRDANREGGRGGRNGRGGRGSRTEGTGQNPGNSTASANPDQTRNEQRSERNNQRNERPDRGGRGPRPDSNENAAQNQGEQHNASANAFAPAPASDNQNETRDNGGRSGRGRGRRSERGPRQDGTDQALENPQAVLGFNDGADAQESKLAANSANADDTSPAQDNAPREGGGRGERRSRDRYGRDRGPRQDRGDRADREAQPPFADTTPLGAQTETTVEPVASSANTAPATSAYAAMPTSASQQSTSAPVANAAAAAPAAAATPTPSSAKSAGMPAIASYALPTDALQQVAQSSGLQWVNSDPARIASVQAAIAAEIPAVHAPRQRPASVVQDNSPLVLVETKRDLSAMQLPFEQGSKDSVQA